MAEGNCERWERYRPKARNKESRIAEIQVSDVSFLGGRGGGRKAEREETREGGVHTYPNIRVSTSTTERPWSKEGMKARAGFGA